jgi:hypothetical protein
MDLDEVTAHVTAGGGKERLKRRPLAGLAE